MSKLDCRHCGADVHTTRTYLERVNEKGVDGIWQCAGGCEGPVLSDDERLIAALEDALSGVSGTTSEN